MASQTNQLSDTKWFVSYFNQVAERIRDQNGQHMNFQHQVRTARRVMAKSDEPNGQHQEASTVYSMI